MTIVQFTHLLLLPWLFYSAHVLPLEGKSMLCTLILLLTPLLCLGGVVAGLWSVSHWSLIAILRTGAASFKDTQAAISLLAPLGRLGSTEMIKVAHVCDVFLARSAIEWSGDFSDSLAPRFLPILFLASAGAQIVAGIVSCKALFSNVNDIDPDEVHKHPTHAWKMRIVGVALMYFGLPIEAIAAYGYLCVPLPEDVPASVTALLSWFIVTGVPSMLPIIGATIMFIAEVRIFIFDHSGHYKIVPVAKSPTKPGSTNKDDNMHLRSPVTP